MRVLIVEDDLSTAQSMELMMKSEGFTVYPTDLGDEAIDLAKIYDYDIITLDLGLPDMNGMEVLRQIRAGKVTTPVIVVSGRNEVETKIAALKAGADDYLTKPFHKDELIARIHAIVRRSKGHAQPVITTGLIAVNLDARELRVDGKHVHLTRQEYKIIELLSLRKGSTITKEQFMNHLYGGMDEPELKIIDVFVCKLRRKLRMAGAQNHVATDWGRGYVLVDTPRDVGITATSEKPQRILSFLSNGAPYASTEIAEALRMDTSLVRYWLQRMTGLVEIRGAGKATTWIITDAGMADHLSRNPESQAAE